MKKFVRILCMALLLTLLMMVATSASAANRYCRGEHDLIQTDFSYPTCTEDGHYTLKCKKCSYIKIVTNGEAYGHDWEKTKVQEATCTKKGWIIYQCANCYEEQTETVMQYGHHWVKQKTVAATCAKEGYVQYYCDNSGCKETKKETLKKIDHKWKTGKVIEAATCVAKGKVEAICTMCGATTTRNTDKIAHAYGMWQITTAATDCTKGVKTRTCTVCRHSETQEFYPDGTLYRNIDAKEAVKELQQMLKDCGYLKDKVDGAFGKNTEAAVKAFQKKEGLKQDGIAWPQTITRLKAAWEIKLGITPVPTTTPAPTATPAPKNVLFCTYELNEQGITVPVYCEVHRAMHEGDAALMATELTDEARIEAAEQIRTNWEAEIERLYEEWFNLAEDTDKGLTVTAHAMFKSHVAMQETTWNKQYQKTPLVVLEMVNELMTQQAVDLCSIVYGFKGIPATTANGYVTVSLVKGWYLSDEKTFNYITLYNDKLGTNEECSLVIMDIQAVNAETEKTVTKSAFRGKEFTEVTIGANNFVYISNADGTHFALIASTSNDKAVKIEGKGCTLEQTMVLLETMVIR